MTPLDSGTGICYHLVCQMHRGELVQGQNRWSGDHRESEMSGAMADSCSKSIRCAWPFHKRGMPSPSNYQPGPRTMDALFAFR